MAADEIDLKELKMVINNILDTLIERTEFGTFSLGRLDNYWEVLGDEMFDVSKDPGELGVGSLVDDIDLLHASSRAIIDGYPPVIYSLVHAVPLLKFLAERHSESNNP